MVIVFSIFGVFILAAAAVYFLIPYCLTSSLYEGVSDEEKRNSKEMTLAKTQTDTLLAADSGDTYAIDMTQSGRESHEEEEEEEDNLNHDEDNAHNIL